MTKLHCLLILLAAGPVILSGCHRQDLEPIAQRMEPAWEKTVKRHEALGDEYYQEQRYAEARQEWALVLQLQPDNKRVRQKISSLTSSGKPGDQPGRMAVGTTKGLNHLERLLFQAEQFYQHSQLKEAEISWQSVLTMAPQNADAKTGLSRLKEEVYQADAQRPFDKMAAALYEEGMEAYRQKDWARAQIKLREAEKLVINQPQINHYLERVNQVLARQAFEQEMLALRQQAQALEAKQSWREAFLVWQQVQEKLPDDQGCSQGLARCRAALQPWVEEQLHQGQAALADRDNSRARRYFNRILSFFPRQLEARQGLIQADALRPKEPEQPSGREQARVKFNQGVTCYRQGHYHQAVSLWEAAVRLDPDEANYQSWLKKGRDRAVRQQAQQIRQADVRYADGLAAYQRGELEEALKDWKEVLSLNPEHEKAKININRVQKELE